MENHAKLLLIGTLLVVATGCGTIRKDKPPEPDYSDVLAAMQQSRPVNGAIFSAYQRTGFIEDPKAENVGDILTILLVEKTDASKKANTSTKKETSVVNANPEVFGRPITHNGQPLLSGSLDGKQSFVGDGASSQSNSLQGTISVTVVARFPNGNLKVAGKKRLDLNQGSEYVTITGIVRPLDISTANTVASDRLAFAEISYGGKGVVNDASAMGFLARFFNSPWALF